MTNNCEPAWEAKIPIPKGAIKPNFTHFKLGKPKLIHEYYNSKTELEGYTCRFETEDGKEMRPLHYGVTNGIARWSWKGKGSLYSLYNLPELCERIEAPILVVEGEKTANAAKIISPDYVVVTSAFGANASHKTDWSPVKNRDVVIFPDNDEVGFTYAKKVANFCMIAGARSIRIVLVPESFPEGWDLADPLPDGVTL